MTRWLLLLALTLCAVLARAHPLSVSYVEMKIEADGIDMSVEVQNVDLSHDLPDLSGQALLNLNSLKEHQTEIASLITSRLTLGTPGSPLQPTVTDILSIPDQKSVRLWLHYAWHNQPSNIAIQCQLFPYHPAHQTLVAVYEKGILRRQMTFDSQITQQNYVLGSHQSVASVMGQFLVEGINHIFTGPDHILFIVGLLLLGGTLIQLLKVVTAFTIAHSITLCLAALNIVNPPSRVIEPTIALSIVFVGVHGLLVLRRSPEKKPLPDLRLVFAFGFGFIHGFGFANALHELELPRQALIAALFSFNLGVECGQACIVLAVAPLLALLRRKSYPAAKIVEIAGSLAVIGMGALWFVQRVLTS